VRDELLDGEIFYTVLIQTWSDRRCWLFEPF